MFEESAPESARMTSGVENRLRDVRLDKDLTQEALAEVIGVTRQTIIAIEKQKFVPSVRLALQLARVLRVPIEELFWLTDVRRKAS